MKYQKIAKLVDDTSNQPSKFRTRNWVEINDESRRAYTLCQQIFALVKFSKSDKEDFSAT